MTSMTKVYLLDDSNNKFFGDGPCRLLQGIEETGSLRASALSMGMAYSKAAKLLTRAEEALGFPLTERQTGGKHGGGSQLTPQGKELVQKYELYRKRCQQACSDIYLEIFSSQ